MLLRVRRGPVRPGGEERRRVHCQPAQGVRLGHGPGHQAPGLQRKILPPQDPGYGLGAVFEDGRKSFEGGRRNELRGFQGVHGPLHEGEGREARRRVGGQRHRHREAGENHGGRLGEPVPAPELHHPPGGGGGGRGYFEKGEGVKACARDERAPALCKRRAGAFFCCAEKFFRKNSAHISNSFIYL